MIDFQKLTEEIQGFFSDTSRSMPPQAGPLVDLLISSGLNPTLLDGLSQNEIVDLLAQHGIDPAQLNPDQLAGLAQAFGLGQQAFGLGQEAAPGQPDLSRGDER